MAEQRRGLSWRLLWPRSRWGRALVIGVPLLLVLVAVAPFVAAVHGLVELLGSLLRPLIDTPTGRLILLNGLLAAAAAIAVLAMRDRIRALRSGLRLRRHLDGMVAFVEGEPRRARELLQRVAKSRVPPPPDLPELGALSRLTLARIALDMDDADAAMRWLCQVRDAELGDELRRSAAQLRFRAVDQQDAALPEQLERDARDALEVSPQDPILLRRLRELLADRGAFEEAAVVQQRVVDGAPPLEVAREQQRLGRDLVAAGESVLRDDAAAVERAVEFADRAGRADPDASAPHLLRGDARRAGGELEAALRAYSEAGDADGVARAASLLDAVPERLSPREILEAFPLDAGLLLAAREYARRGEDRAALRAVRLALRYGGGAPEFALAAASVLRAIGHPDEADRALRAAAGELVAPEAAER